ncbi:MAG: hypothetical protein MUC88_22630, partial [Planctomycetes bacterium]|nr:hypothetical protein [Planctomycetota bacterium]
MRLHLRDHAIGACLILLLSLPAGAGETALPMTSSAWEQKVFPEPGSSISETQAATFSFASEEKLGTCLGIGPWHTGQWGIRCE